MITRYRDGRPYPYRCFVQSTERNRERGIPFPADITSKITVKIYSSENEVSCRLRLINNVTRYTCEVETHPHTYARERDADARLRPAFVREAGRIVDCILMGMQYEPLKDYVANPRIPYDYDRPNRFDLPPPIRDRLVNPKPAAPLPWPVVANAFLEGVRLLNQKSYGILFAGDPPAF